MHKRMSACSHTYSTFNNINCNNKICSMVLFSFFLFHSFVLHKSVFGCPPSMNVIGNSGGSAGTYAIQFQNDHVLHMQSQTNDNSSSNSIICKPKGRAHQSNFFFLQRLYCCVKCKSHPHKCVSECVFFFLASLLPLLCANGFVVILLFKTRNQNAEKTYYNLEFKSQSNRIEFNCSTKLWSAL